MPRCSPNSQFSKAIASPTPQVTGDASDDLPRFNVSRSDATEPPLWFIPHDLPLPPRMQLGPSHCKRRGASHIPRPRNSFILFRSHMLSQRVLPAHVPFCGDHRQVSRIVSHVWRVLPGHEKERFYALGNEERRLHQLRYPAYTSASLTTNENKFKISNLFASSNDAEFGSEDAKCRDIAQVLVQNIQGDELIAKILDIVKTATPEQIKPTPSYVSPRRKTVKDEDMDFDASAEPSKTTHKPAKKAGKAHTKSPRITSKPRSSLSKLGMSKASLDHAYVRWNSPRRVTAFSSVKEEHERQASLEDIAHPLSTQSTPALSNSAAPSPDSFPETVIATPSRSPSPVILEAGLEDWSMNVTSQEPAFDQGADYAVYQDLYGSLVDDSIYDVIAARYSGGVEDEPVGHIPSHGLDPEDSSTMVENDAYINEASRGHYEEDVQGPISPELLY